MFHFSDEWVTNTSVKTKSLFKTQNTADQLSDEMQELLKMFRFSICICKIQDLNVSLCMKKPYKSAHLLWFFPPSNVNYITIENLPALSRFLIASLLVDKQLLEAIEIRNMFISPFPFSCFFQPIRSHYHNASTFPLF